MFGHPLICSLPSQVESSTILDLINQVLQNLSHINLTFDVVVTDGAVSRYFFVLIQGEGMRGVCVSLKCNILII